MKQTFAVYVGDHCHAKRLSERAAVEIAGDLWAMGEPRVSIEKEE